MSFVEFDGSLSTYSWMQWITASLIRAGKSIYTLSESGRVDRKELLALMQSRNATVLACPGSAGEHLFSFAGGVLEVRLVEDDESPVSGVFLDEALRDQVLKDLDTILVRQPPSGTFHVLVKTACGFAIKSAGCSLSPLVRDNYRESELKALDHVMRCMSSDDPCGRLVILDGPPGTGKSYAIRALAHESKSTFVLVAPSLVGKLSGPDLVPVLLEEKQRKRSVVLVMEDADHALVVRNRGDLQQLSELLNMGDGMLGDLVDLRIIATTNTDRTDLDPAVLRPGRLCSHVHFGCLSSTRAWSIYERLVGKKVEIEGPFQESTLADVYRLARQDGWESPGRNGPGGVYA